MNILLASYMEPDAPSGVRVHYQQLAGQLRQRGHRVDVVTPATLASGPRRYLVAALRHLLLRLGPGPQALANNVSCFLLIWWAIDRRRAYDVVNAQDANSGVAARWALGRRVPVVVTGHFNEHPATEELRQQPDLGPAAGAVHRWHNYMLARTRYLLSVSAHGLRVVREVLPASTECRVVPNGIDLGALRADPTPADLRARFPGSLLILNIGQLESRKNQLLLVEAARELRRLRPNFVVGLVGKGEDESLLRQRISDYHLQEHVVLLGYHAPVLPLLRCADLYVHVATHETFGLVLLEAAAAEVPALALAVGGVPEVLHATPEALLPPTTTAAELAAHLHTWLGAPARRHRLAAAQAAAVAEHFGVARMVTATLAFYRHARQHFHHPPPAASSPT